MWYNDKNEREGSHLTPYDETLRTLRQQADRLFRILLAVIMGVCVFNILR